MKYRQKVYSCLHNLQLGLNASDKSHYGKGFYKDDATVRRNLLSIFCQVEKNDGVTKWLAPEGLVGTDVAG